MTCTGKNEKEFTEIERLISRLTGIKELADRSSESTYVSSEILQLCDDGVTSELIQKCIDMLESLSRENLKLEEELAPYSTLTVCKVCQKLVLLPEHRFQSVVGIIHLSCREGLKKMELREDLKKWK